MKKTLNVILAVSMAIGAMLVATGCKSSKSAAGGDYTVSENLKDSPAQLKERFANSVASYKNWTTFKASGKIRVGGTKSFTSSMSLTMVRDKAIMISIKPMFGIELGKIYITSDSIVIVNKMEKYYIAENLKLIANGIPLNIADMQNIFLARMFELGNGTITTQAKSLKSLTNGDDGLMNVRLESQEAGLNYTFGVKRSGEVRNLTLSFNGSISDFFVNYYDHDSTAYGKIANSIEVTSHLGNDDISLKLEYEPMYNEWDKNVRYGSPVDDRYRRIDGKRFLQSWIQ